MILSTTVIGALFDVIIRGLIDENVVLVLVVVYPSLAVTVRIYYVKVYRPSRIRATAPQQGATVDKPIVAPARPKPSRQTKANFGTTYAIGCTGIATILGSVSVVEFYRGITIGSGYFPISQAYAGLALAILAFAFTEIEVKEHPKRFITFQALFVAGVALVAPFIQSTPPFSTTTSFMLGSFALLATGFFITSDNERYHNILLVSIAATAALFFGGMLSAFRDVSGSAAPTTGVAGAFPYVITALFLVGAFDLTLLSALLFRIVMQSVRRARPRPQTFYGLDPIA
jgi:hypothetical protein